jgi:hypothetical protein
MATFKRWLSLRLFRITSHRRFRFSSDPGPILALDTSQLLQY